MSGQSQDCLLLDVQESRGKSSYKMHSHNDDDCDDYVEMEEDEGGGGGEGGG